MNTFTKIKTFFAQVLSRPPYPSPCHGNCNQGRNCDCVPTPEQQKRFQLEDEFNNSNWPFPTSNKP